MQETDCNTIANHGEVICIAVSCEGISTIDNYTLDLHMDASGKPSLSISPETIVISCSVGTSGSELVVTCVGLCGDELCVGGTREITTNDAETVM